MLQNISLTEGAAWYVVFLFSTTVHEASHAFAALKGGDDTAARGGQVSLDPVPHIRREPLGLVVVPILSYVLGGWMMGWASAPYNPDWARRHPARAGLMAMAGPAANLVLLLLCALLIRMGLSMGWLQISGSPSLTQLLEPVGQGASIVIPTLLSIGFSLNVLLFIFNLIPLPPLDGASIPLLFLPRQMALKFWEITQNPAFSFIGLFVAWRLMNLIYPPGLGMALRLIF